MSKCGAPTTRKGTPCTYAPKPWHNNRCYYHRNYDQNKALAKAQPARPGIHKNAPKRRSPRTKQASATAPISNQSVAIGNQRVASRTPRPTVGKQRGRTVRGSKKARGQVIGPIRTNIAPSGFPPLQLGLDEDTCVERTLTYESDDSDDESDAIVEYVSDESDDELALRQFDTGLLDHLSEQLASAKYNFDKLETLISDARHLLKTTQKMSNITYVGRLGDALVECKCELNAFMRELATGVNSADIALANSRI